MNAAVLSDPEIAFDEPWQAEAFATAVHLSRAGLFTWTEWVKEFSETIAREPLREGETAGDAYYRQWMSALEAMLGRTLCLSDQAVAARQALWHAAYLNTPHGQPVQLGNAAALSGTHSDGHHHHDHHSHVEVQVRRPAPRPATVVLARK